MSKLDEQIKILQRKKAKIELFERIIANLGKEKDGLPEFPGLMSEVAVSIQDFCKNQISSIEGSQPPAPVNPSPVTVNEKVTEALPTKRQINIEKDEIFGDTLKFIVHFKEWVNKDIILHDDSGNSAKGVFLGIAYPNVRVKVGEKVISVDPRTVELSQ